VPPPPSQRVRDRFEALADSRFPVAAWAVVVLAGLGALVAAMLPAGPSWLSGAGAVAVASAYTWALAARIGGRPMVFGGLALALGIAVLLLDLDALRTGAAVLTCVVAAVLGVVATVPAKTYLRAAREATIAVLIAAVGGLATVGFEPVITLVRFEYATLGLALLGAFGVVYRLGAGLHGLGRRGALVVLIGTALLALTLVYAEMVRSLLDGVGWSRENVGAFPRPIESILGVPALVWGCHMRARRRQGWWVCAFGVGATASVAQALLNPRVSPLESGLSAVYGLVVGLVTGFVVIRVDLAFTGPRGGRARRAEEAAAVRPEPSRTQPLL
jgi:hypothetical protein